MNARNIIVATHDSDGRLFAAWDPFAEHVEPAVRSSRFGAFLAPFPSRDEAERALIAAGAVIDSDCLVR